MGREIICVNLSVLGGNRWSADSLQLVFRLPDGDRRRYADYLIDIRFIHPFENCVHRPGQRFDIPPMALGIERIECRLGCGTRDW